MAASTLGSPTAREAGARARDESASVVLEPPVRGKSPLRVRDPDRRPALHLPPLPLCLATKGSTSTGGTASHLMDDLTLRSNCCCHTWYDAHRTGKFTGDAIFFISLEERLPRLVVQNPG